MFHAAATRGVGRDVEFGPLPSQWIRVRLADADPEGARGALMAAVFGADVVCTAVGRDGAGVRAICTRGGT